MDPPRCNRLNVAILDEKKRVSRNLCLPYLPSTSRAIESFGLLVPLGYDIAACTPAAYLRHRL